MDSVSSHSPERPIILPSSTSGRVRPGSDRDFRIPNEGIDREVITYEITRYLGQDALVRPGKNDVCSVAEYEQENAGANPGLETSQRLFDYSISCADDRMTICAPERIFSDLKLPGDDPLNEGSIRQISS
jgi:hypothetical protein